MFGREKTLSADQYKMSVMLAEGYLVCMKGGMTTKPWYSTRDGRQLQLTASKSTLRSLAVRRLVIMRMNEARVGMYTLTPKGTECVHVMNETDRREVYSKLQNVR